MFWGKEKIKVKFCSHLLSIGPKTQNSIEMDIYNNIWNHHLEGYLVLIIHDFW